MASLVSVSSLGGLLCTVEVDPNCPVSELKRKISEVTQIPVEVQRILQGARELGGNDLLPTTCEELTLVRRTEEQVFWLKKVSSRPGELKRAPESIKVDKEVVLAAVRTYGRVLRYAAPALRCDPAIVLAAVSQNGSALEFASPDMRRNRDIACVAVQQHGLALQFADPVLTSDVDIVLIAVQTCGLALRYAAKEHRVNPMVTLAAVRQNAGAVEEMLDTHDMDNLGALLTAVGVPSVIVDRIMASAAFTKIQSSPTSIEIYKLLPMGQEAFELFKGNCSLASEIVEKAVADAKANIKADVISHEQLVVSKNLLVAKRAELQLAHYTKAALILEYETKKAESDALRAQLPWAIRGRIAFQNISRDARNLVSRCRSRSCRRRIQEPEVPEDESANTENSWLSVA